jgi:small subunit ribosomal protein S20
MFALKKLRLRKIGVGLLANHKSALKRVRSSEKKRVRNQRVRSRARTEIKKALKFIEQGDLENARSATREAIRALDKAAVKGVIHSNNAARRKSRLMKRLTQLEAEAS